MGILYSNVSYKDGMAHVKYDLGIITLQEIIHGIQDVEFKAESNTQEE